MDCQLSLLTISFFLFLKWIFSLRSENAKQKTNDALQIRSNIVKKSVQNWPCHLLFRNYGNYEKMRTAYFMQREKKIEIKRKQFEIKKKRARA